MLGDLESSELPTSETLVKYDMAPPTLKVRAITKIAIQLCQHTELKKIIIFESQQLRLHNYRTEDIYQWSSLIIQQSADICEKIPLPVELKKRLIARFQSVFLQLLHWNRLQAKFDLSPFFAYSLLTPSDWTADGRLDENKIAVRLVQHEGIPAFQRYKMACFHCLEHFIYTLWDQVKLTCRYLFHCRIISEYTLVEIWSRRMAGKLLFTITRYFRHLLLMEAVKEGSISATYHRWYLDELSARPTYAVEAVENMVGMYGGNFMGFNQLNTVCFLLTHLPKDKALSILDELLKQTNYNMLIWFVQWPYLDILIPIIKELWNILPVVNYGDLLLTLAHNYADEAGCSIRAIGYVDYDYGDLMIELLEESPDRFKRYLFSDDHHTNKILYIMIRKKNLNYRNIKIFQNIWHHVTLEERRSFFKSRYGELFCCCLAREENFELLDSLLKECLPEDEVAMFQNKISKRILQEVDEEPAPCIKG